MRNLFVFLCVLTSCALATAQEEKEVFGKITDEYGPLENVVVSIEGSQKRAFSDEGGNYRIYAQEGDILLYELLGKLPMEIKVEDVTRVLNVTLRDKVEKLSGVTVTEKRRMKSQEQMSLEYASNPNIVKNAFGFLDKERVGYSLRILDEKDIGPQYINLATLLNGRFAGIRARCNAIGELEVALRNGATSFSGTNSVVYDVDGIILERMDCYTLDPSLIKRIAVNSSLVGTSLYGMKGRGGVIIINTKSGTFSSVQNNNYKRFKNKLNQESLFNGEAIPLVGSQPLPIYMESYLAANSEEEAIVAYENQLVKYANSFYFVLDSYRYFMDRWDNNKFVSSLLEDNWRLFEGNPVALKSLAYIHQANGDFALAKAIYKEVFLLRPEYVQSYFNMAESYVENKQFNLAASMYSRFDYLKQQGFLSDDKGEFSAMLDSEFKNLLGLKGNDLLTTRQRKKLASNEDFKGTRLVFEWADSEAEFELQFVNPENRFFTWKHTAVDNGEIIKDEKTLGYSTKEYRLGNTYPGEWQVNINYFGNKSLTPTYLKATIYQNYGESSQTKETKVFKLMTKNVNQHLFNVFNNAEIVSN